MADLMSTLKAPTFLGFLSIRMGLFIISFIQILTGILVFFALHYLRPALHWTQWFLLFSFVISALLGIWGAWKRRQVVETIYFVTFICCAVLLLFLAMDFADVVHLLPKAPPGASSSNFLRVESGLQARNHNVHFRNSSEHALLLKVLQHAEPEKTENENESVVAEIPFIPHNETEGESEEVSKDELPPETEKLSEEGKDEIVVIAKMAKQPIKLAMAGVSGLLFLFYMYFTWIVLTFVLNKCTSLDELTGQPEQFEPLVAGH